MDERVLAISPWQHQCPSAKNYNSENLDFDYFTEFLQNSPQISIFFQAFLCGNSTLLRMEFKSIGK
jgi:hypothetical protein